MIKGKKGALELSVNTIVVIVIGVTLLVLGLVFVRGIFQKIDTLSAESFGRAEGELSKIAGIDKPLTISPQSIDLEVGGAKQVDVIIANLGGTTATVSATATSSSTTLKCVFNDNTPFDATSEQYSINSGDQVKLHLIADDKGSPIGIAGCIVQIQGLTGQTRDTLNINIIPK